MDPENQVFFFWKISTKHISSFWRSKMFPGSNFESRFREVHTNFSKDTTRGQRISNLFSEFLLTRPQNGSSLKSQRWNFVMIHVMTFWARVVNDPEGHKEGLKGWEYRVWYKRWCTEKWYSKEPSKASPLLIDGVSSKAVDQTLLA